MDLEWLFTKVRQLKQSWKRNLGKTPRTFNRLERDIIRDIEKLTVILEDNIINSWSVLKEIENNRDQYRGFSDALLSAYSERMEGKQITTSIEPSIRMGETAGVYDQVLDVIDKILRVYSGKIKTEHNRFIFSKGGRSYGWEGISSTWLNQDFEIFPHYQIFRAPINIKVNPRSLLSPISHETAHFIFFNIKPLGNPFFNRNMKNPIQDIHLLYLSFLYEFYTNREMRNITKPNRREIGEMQHLIKNKTISYPSSWDNMHRYLRHNPLYELFTDFMAGIIAGPTFFINLNEIRYGPKYSDYSTALSHYDRLYLGHQMGKALKLDTRPEIKIDWLDKINLDPGIDGWGPVSAKSDSDRKNLANIQRRQVVEREWRARASHRFENLLFRQLEHHIDHLETMFQNDVDVTDMIGYWMRTKQDWEALRDYTYKYDLTNASRILGQRKYIEAITNYFDMHYEKSPVFFTDLSIDKIWETWKECKDIAKRLWYDSEVVTDKRIADLIAASNMHPMRLPHYPTGRVYQSIIWAEE